MNKTILKPRLATATGRANTQMWDFPDVVKFRVAAHIYGIGESNRFQHPDYNPDWAQKLIIHTYIDKEYLYSAYYPTVRVCIHSGR